MAKIYGRIGHGGKDSGAVNPSNGYTELKYNTELVSQIENKLKSQYEILIENRGNNKMEDVNKVNNFKPELIISFHCNASNGKGTGTEAIYYPSSIKGKELATIVSKNVSEALGLKNRGAKEPYNGRGEALLQRTKAPCIISEGFFIDNNTDLEIGIGKMNKYVDAIEKSIHEFLGDSEITTPEKPKDTKIYLVKDNKTIGEIEGTIKIY